MSFVPRLFSSLFSLCAMFLVCACSFNYDTAPQDDGEPDLVMENAEYVQIVQGNPEVRLGARELRRYEAKHLMELDELSFEQYNAAPEDAPAVPDVNARGSAAFARLETDTRNVSLSGGVSIEVQSEDMAMETPDISWQDKERILAAPGKIRITRSDGTLITGTGLSVDARRRSWEFESAVEGSIVEDKKDEP